MKQLTKTLLTTICLFIAAISGSAHLHETASKSGKTSSIESPLKLTSMSLYPKPKSLSAPLPVEATGEMPKAVSSGVDEAKFIRVSKKRKETVGRKHGRPSIDYRRYVLKGYMRKIQAERRQKLIDQLVQEAQGHAQYYLTRGFSPLMQQSLHLLEACKTVEQVRSLSEVHFKTLLDAALLVDVYEVLGPQKQLGDERSRRIRPLFQGSQEKLLHLQGLKERISAKFDLHSPKTASVFIKV